MTERSYVRPKKRHSLYFGLIVNITLGILIAVAAYFALRLASSYFINTRYLSDEAKSERLKEHISNLQSYATRNDISSEDTDKIAYWAKQNPYVYLMVYKNDVLFFSSDMNDKEDNKENDKDGDSSDGEENGGADSGEGNPEGGASGGASSGGGSADSGEGSDKTPDGSKPSQDEAGKPTDKEDNKNDNKNDYDGILGIGGNKIDRETLIKEAEASGMHPIELADGTIFAEIADYSETLYLSLSNIFSMAAGIIIFAVILIIYFRRIIVRLKKLESDVNIVSHINMNHSIDCNGKDEISMLSRNVENMRNSILDNLEKERAARAANTELVTAMSHDIRTPLTVLLGYIDMLKNYDGCDETVKSYVGATEKTAMRLKELSDGMFKYSLAFGSTDEQIALEKYNALMLVEQLFLEHILLLSENGYDVQLDKRLESVEEGATVKTDPQNLMRIVDNIFQNIYKYASKAEPIDFSLIAEKERIRFVIRNRITEEPVEAESNGIGLKTCKRLAQYIAEDFSYESDGKHFTVSLSLRLENIKHENHKQKGKSK